MINQRNDLIIYIIQNTNICFSLTSNTYQYINDNINECQTSESYNLDFIYEKSQTVDLFSHFYNKLKKTKTYVTIYDLHKIGKIFMKTKNFLIYDLFS